MTAALITFVVPYYRGRSYLQKALESVVAQDEQRWVAIVVDDCGGEDAEDIVVNLGDKRISYVRNSENLGLARNWNKGVALANTEFVTILHADDELEPWYARDILALMHRHEDASIGHCRTSVIGVEGRRIFSLPDHVKKVIRPRSRGDVITAGEAGLTSLLRGAWIFCPTMCFRKSHFSDELFSNEWKMVLDLDLTSRLLLRGGLIVGSTTVSYRYRRHEENQTALLTKEMTRFREEIELLDRLERDCSELGWHRASRVAHRKAIVRLNLLYQSTRCLVAMKFTEFGRFFAAAVRGTV